jgi:hypothetical protein
VWGGTRTAGFGRLAAASPAQQEFHGAQFDRLSLLCYRGGRRCRDRD